MSRSPDEFSRRLAMRIGFEPLRGLLDLHPSGSTPAATFTAAAETTRQIVRQSLPFGVAVVMHLYPLCVLRWIPIPWWAPAASQRRALLRHVDREGLILANAGSERAAGAHAPVAVTRTANGVSVNGSFDYVSLASVADHVLFSAPLAGSGNTVFCIADRRSGSTRIGESRFDGSMLVSDTCSMSFENHEIPRDRFLVVPGQNALQCMSQYQRSWFHLLLAEAYLARIAHLHERHDLPRSIEGAASLNELALLRDYAVRLLDEASSGPSIETLARASSALKLRVSWQAQATAAALRDVDEVSARELGFIKLQPTSDDRIVQSLLVKATPASIPRPPVSAPRQRHAPLAFQATAAPH